MACTAVVFNAKLRGAPRNRICAAAPAGAELDAADGYLVRAVEHSDGLVVFVVVAGMPRRLGLPGR